MPLTTRKEEAAENQAKVAAAQAAYAAYAAKREAEEQRLRPLTHS